MKNENITNNDYKKALKGWNALDCKILTDYQRVYCEKNVLLLVDVFVLYRKTCIRDFDLDPVEGYTLPGQSWKQMLKYTGQVYELITDSQTYEDLDKGIRGGVSMCVTRYAKANNKYMKNYDPKKESSFILYLDKNN